jgi:diguanylate cyclase (GGDEF)-like protein
MSKLADTGFRLLIVDDNEAIHNDLKKVLLPREPDLQLSDDEALLFGQPGAHTVPFTIDSAFQGEEALARVQEATLAGRPYAVAFVDVRMPPGWDGIETISHLWQVDPRLQVVICTAYSDYSWNDIERTLGVSQNLVVLKKPFDPIEVTQLAHALTEKWASARQANLRMEELDRMVEQRTAELLALVGQLETARESAEIAALHDPLTKLPNRRLFQSRLTQALERAERSGSPCALLYLDLDRFNVINDSLGHQAGDELLVAVAGRLQSCLRRTDSVGRLLLSETLVARLGGDAFAILLENIKDVSDVLRVADRVSARLSGPFRLRERDLSITASIGIAITASRRTTAEGMLRDADTAMYRAKAAGRGGRVIFDDAMHTQAVERLQLEAELRRALDRQEFTLLYQPIVSLPHGQIAGFEALIRWQSPERGLVMPTSFLPVAEETGLIVPIGAWVLREACLQMQRWRQRFGGEPLLTMSVNLSAKQFSQLDLVDMVAETLHETELNGQSLRLELTETVAMKEPERTAHYLNQLRLLGVRLSIDDFGTGYSSMDHLHRFPLDILKIDRHFVSRIGLDERDHNIVRTMISLAHNLHMEVVAEGAETAEHVALLKTINCDYVQGYFFFKPMEPAKLEPFLEKQYSESK